MQKRNEMEKKNFRYNMLSTIIYMAGTILIFQLFNLQIINGQEYREKSDTRLTRETIVEASRGSIYDRSGIELVGTKMGFTLELYKTKLTNNELNSIILNIINILEKNGDKYIDNFPIDINKHNFTNEEKFIAWKKELNIKEELNAKETFEKFKEKYKIENYSDEEARKIIAIRYEINIKGYSSLRGLTIANNISRESAIEINEKNTSLQGISVVLEPIRDYKQKELASHILGYMGKISEEEYKEKKNYGYENDDYIGKTGIEYTFEEYLKGENGKKQIDVNIEGKVTEEYITKEAISGDSIILTIDAKLQKITEDALKNNIEKIKSGQFGKIYEAKGGAAVVMSVQTGEILSLASYPYYEPEILFNGISKEKLAEYNKTGEEALFNRAIQGKYAPGSIFKMISAIAALESEVATREELINDTGQYPLYQKPKCWLYSERGRGHGNLNVLGAIKHSCNYYFYEIGNRMGIDTLEEYARYFGLGEKTGIELPWETSGTLASREEAEKKNAKWQPGDILSAVIGQSYNAFSPIQIARYISILANGGIQVYPSIVKDIININGKEITEEEINTNLKKILGIDKIQKDNLEIQKENLEIVLEGMRSVTSETGGTAYARFQNFDIELGGKTGSAEAGKYTNAWFVGFAPFENPEIAVVVMVENGGHGNYTAEVVREIVKEYFGMNTENIDENLTAIPYIQTVR